MNEISTIIPNTFVPMPYFNFCSRHHREEPVKENNHAKLKALQETILRMNEKSFRLTAENKSLKQDLEKTMDDLARAKERQSTSPSTTFEFCIFKNHGYRGRCLA